ncbi:MAG: hypothetical protein CVU78_04665 [Elusimicrobia bacterium HGW-Elusimicrobia-2]|nr:MAG: hypothetical protein CVU78_04665 [Elusimicrobia bacterium HGW-Elusimicrobia-2]
MNKINFKNLKIRSKMLFLHFIFIIPVFMALGSWQIWVMKKELAEKNIGGFLSDARGAMDFMGFAIYTAASSVQSFAGSPVFENNYSSADRIARMKEWKKHHCFRSVSYFDSLGTLIADTDNAELGKKYPLEGFWDDVLAGKLSSGSDFRIDSSGKIPTLFFACPVTSAGRVTGAVVARCDFSKFAHIVQIIKDDRIHVTLLDRTGRIIYSACSLQKEIPATGDAAKIPAVVEACGEKDLVKIKIKDNGPGIDEKTRKSIFEPFFTTKDKGTGLGLAIVYGIVKDLGGKIHVDSREGEYTEFVIELPVGKQVANSDYVI